MTQNSYIIIELIPTHSQPQFGEVVQISALKIQDFNVLDRFDYRLNKQLIKISDLAEMLSYDESEFTYKNSTNEIMHDFASWIQNYPLLIITNGYTENYLKYYNINNNLISILDILNLQYHNDIINTILNKYNLQPSNYIVDILFEALIYESNNFTNN